MAEEGHPERYRVICFEGAFHGRTLAMLAATGNAKYLKGFGPPVAGLRSRAVQQPQRGARGDRAGDRAASWSSRCRARAASAPRASSSCAISARPADEFGLLLGMDEIQCGMGRTGKLFAHEWAGITPDVMSAAKGIAGGFPMGAVLATERVARNMVPGTHGSTFGGNPLASAAAQRRARRHARPRLPRQMWTARRETLARPRAAGGRDSRRSFPRCAAPD